MEYYSAIRRSDVLINAYTIVGDRRQSSKQNVKNNLDNVYMFLMGKTS